MKTQAERCPHGSYATVFKMRKITVKSAEVYDQLVLRLSIRCKLCGRPFQFRGHIGFSTVEPSMSEDGMTLNIPIDYPDDELPEEELPPEEEEDEEPEPGPKKDLLN